MLERLRLPAESSAARRYPEPSHPYRTDFQRDRDRIVHARAFRRLEGKTQVFTAGFDDHFRNRLTHTIEVAQVARTVSHALGLNDEYTECLALAHDLGHPPFGHSGEKELDRKMRQFGACFEHNAHSLRIVDVLEVRYARFSGLNLTGEVREGIIKHSRELSAGNAEYPELSPGLKPALEAQLLDLADEIAYITADLDDAFAARMVTSEQLSDTVPEFRTSAQHIDTAFPGLTPRIRFWEIQRHMMNYLIGGLLDGTLQAVRELHIVDLYDLRHCSQRAARFTAPVLAVARKLKDILVEQVYQNPDLKRDRATAVTKVGWFFDYLMQSPESIPSAYRLMLEHEPLHRVVCDYIAGMTDSYFERRFDDIVAAT